ncbi:hypothetical protein [Streptomyces sp. RFCAC02]|nr:hypothetical protein [Streptomyces sp. RFCAC02]
MPAGVVVGRVLAVGLVAAVGLFVAWVGLFLWLVRVLAEEEDR